MLFTVRDVREVKIGAKEVAVRHVDLHDKLAARLSDFLRQIFVVLECVNAWDVTNVEWLVSIAFSSRYSFRRDIIKYEFPVYPRECRLKCRAILVNLISANVYVVWVSWARENRQVRRGRGRRYRTTAGQALSVSVKSHLLFLYI